MGSRLVAHDPSVRDDADTSPAELGRGAERSQRNFERNALR